MAKYIVTITPPTPNGDLHIGHISGPFLAADVFTRAQRQQGHDCVLVSYSDDYQSYMLRKGLETDTDPVVLARRNTDRIEQSLVAVDIRVDKWMRPYENRFFRDAVTEVFEQARACGAIEFRESVEPYCPPCDKWGYEAFGRGKCNFCGADSDASQCEGCAQAPDAARMKDFVCKLCGKPHQWTPVRRAFLKLGNYRALLNTLHARHPQRAPLDSWLAPAVSEIGDWGVTRPGDAGLDLAPDGSCRVHTWFMGLAGYIAAFREYAYEAGKPGLYKEYWGSGKGSLVHFLGFDCVFSHAIVYPVLLSMLPDVKVSQHFVPNQFLKLDGLNLSTSRNHAIWVADLAREACADSARLYLASIAPEETEGDFVCERFRAWRQAVFDEFVPALLAAGKAGGKQGWDDLAGHDGPLIQGLRLQWLDAARADRFSMKRMAGVVLNAIEITRGRLADQRPVGHLAAFIAVAGKALTPGLSARLVAAFDLPEDEVTMNLLSGSSAEYSI
ncbi:methionine--tRNA ligase [Verminephrobacter aporrectodeae subsp. tuberculatae]|uniref:methionine--tRNA ligase n=1 Tax=Verminephrobacter aporrectodeae TaxID=1110389 RepID=UPI002238805A|nr:methionine--tRNA ligase [Verminephrobacter aporrectodeae]MCW5255098.1 methionine--tRNA ligase [Verminephrobacter aporrectodeae subsp. tuberculatae]